MLELLADVAIGGEAYSRGNLCEYTKVRSLPLRAVKDLGLSKSFQDFEFSLASSSVNNTSGESLHIRILTECSSNIFNAGSEHVRPYQRK